MEFDYPNFLELIKPEVLQVENIESITVLIGNCVSYS